MAGNTSVSSLISGASAARKRQQAYNDQAAEYEWSTSAQTGDDYAAYQAYLKKRQAETVDPSKQLTIQSKLDSAQGGYVSNEIQRQTQSVIYGEQDNRTKYAKILPLYEQARASGNMNLAQNLESTLASLSKTIQTEDQTAATTARVSGERAVAADLKAFKAGVTEATKNIDRIHDAFNLAYTNKDVLRDENNQPIKGRLQQNADGSVQIILDDNGQPIRPTARQMAQIKSYTMAQKASVLEQAANSGNDEDGTYYDKLRNLQQSADWQKYASPELQARLNREGGGENPFTNKIDPITGRTTPELRQVSDFNGDANLYRNGFMGAATDQSGNATVNPVDISFNRKAGTSPSDITDNYTVQSYAVDGNNFARKLKDPITGKTLYAGTNDKSILNPGIPGTIAQTGEDLQAGHTVNELDVAKQFYGDLIAHPSETLSEVGGGISHALGGTPDLHGVTDMLHNPGMRVANVFNPMVSSLQQITNIGQAHSAQLRQEAARAEQLRQAMAVVEQRNQAAAAALAAIPKAVPSKPVTISGTGTLNNVVGPRAVPVAVQKAANTVGTQQFTQQLYPKVNLTPPKAAPTPTAPAPQNTKQWWNPLSWFK